MKSPAAADRGGGRPITYSNSPMWRRVSRGMPRYFFDVSDTGRRFSDTEGTELDDIEAARKEALAALGGIAKDELPDGDFREFVIEVRDGDGAPQLTASLSLRVD